MNDIKNDVQISHVLTEQDDNNIDNHVMKKFLSSNEGTNYNSNYIDTIFSRIKAFFNYIEIENKEKIFKINENITINDNMIFNICSILQIIIFLCITWNQILSNIENLNNTNVQEAVHTNEFLVFSSAMLTSCSIILLNSIFDFIEKTKTIKLFFELFMKILLFGAIISPFIGALISFKSEEIDNSQLYPCIYYVYFFLVQQNILAMLLAIQVGSIYNNKVINYFSLSFLQLLFHIGTASFVAYTKVTIDYDETTNKLILCSYIFSYGSIILYTIMVLLKVVSFILFKKLDLVDYIFISISFTALGYQIGLSIIYESIGINIIDQNVGDAFGFMLMIIILSFVLNLLPQKIMRSKLQIFTYKLEKALNEARIIEKEKHMASNLLSKILPESVVAELQAGKNVTPEYYEEASIFFSDIEGFTNICSVLSPNGVVNFLNKTYTVMDFAQSLLPTYKVETIGDAYVVASGLPKRDINHATNVANFALLVRELVSLVKSPIADTVRVRIGIHSGPVTAGIVGTTMPRYCLFGDTVNVASRMESTGIVNMIQISEKTYNYLEKTGEFILEERGIIDVKGKGQMKTYFLTDFSNNNKTINYEFLEKAKKIAGKILSNLKETDISTFASVQEFLNSGVDNISSVSSNASGSNTSTAKVMKKNLSMLDLISMTIAPPKDSIIYRRDGYRGGKPASLNSKCDDSVLSKADNSVNSNSINIEF